MTHFFQLVRGLVLVTAVWVGGDMLAASKLDGQLQPNCSYVTASDGQQCIVCECAGGYYWGCPDGQNGNACGPE